VSFPIRRRSLLKAALAAGPALSVLPRLAFAAEPTAAIGTLVVIFLRGGCDGLNLVAPTDDPGYVAARTPEMRVLGEGSRPGVPLGNGLAPDIDFRLHPDAEPLGDLYRAGHLAVVHAAGITDGTRSHFVAQDLMEYGVVQEAELARADRGWMTRWLEATDTHNGLAALTTTPAATRALAGFGAALPVTDLRSGLLPPGGPQAAAVLSALYAEGGGPFERAARETLAGMALVDGRLTRAPDRKVEPYQTENGASYPETEIGRSLQTVARVLKMEIGLRTAGVDMGGWDTHEGQPGRFSALTSQLAQGLGAFWNDAHRFHNQTTVVVMSEFGRRLRSNRSQGTDHGHGGVMLVLGGRVCGGRMFGRWPGLAAEQLDRGVDLAITTDYRTVLAELIGEPSASAVFGASGLGASLGLLRQ
jgi:uncharacterized protein (DUF1501 family)